MTLRIVLVAAVLVSGALALAQSSPAAGCNSDRRASEREFQELILAGEIAHFSQPPGCGSHLGRILRHRLQIQPIP